MLRKRLPLILATIALVALLVGGAGAVYAQLGDPAAPPPPVITYVWDAAHPPTRFEMDVRNSGTALGKAHLRALYPDGLSVNGSTRSGGIISVEPGADAVVPLLPQGQWPPDGVITRITLTLFAGPDGGSPVAVDNFEIDVDRRGVAPGAQNIRAAGVPRLVE